MFNKNEKKNTYTEYLYYLSLIFNFIFLNILVRFRLSKLVSDISRVIRIKGSFTALLFSSIKSIGRFVFLNLGISEHE